MKEKILLWIKQWERLSGKCRLNKEFTFMGKGGKVVISTYEDSNAIVRIYVRISEGNGMQSFRLVEGFWTSSIESGHAFKDLTRDMELFSIGSQPNMILRSAFRGGI